MSLFAPPDLAPLNGLTVPVCCLLVSKLGLKTRQIRGVQRTVKWSDVMCAAPEQNNLQSRAGCPNLEVVQLAVRTSILHRQLKTQFDCFHRPLHCLHRNPRLEIRLPPFCKLFGFLRLQPVRPHVVYLSIQKLGCKSSGLSSGQNVVLFVRACRALGLGCMRLFGLVAGLMPIHPHPLCPLQSELFCAPKAFVVHQGKQQHGA